MPDWQLLPALPDLRRIGLIALDTETKDGGLLTSCGSGWAFSDGYICGISVAYRAEGDIRAHYFPIAHPNSQNFDREQLFQWLRDLIASDVHIVTQNGLYDWGWLRAEAGIVMPPSERLEEIGALATMIDENRFRYSLDALCAWRGLPGKDEDLLKQAAIAAGLPKRAKPQSLIWQLPAHVVGPYAEADAARTLALFESLDPVLDRENTRNAYRLEVDLLPMCLEMRRRGIRVNSPAAEQARDQLLQKRDAVFAEISEMLGSSVGMAEIGRTKWLAETFDQQNIPYPRTEKGNPSFTAGNNGWMPKHPHWLPRLIVKADKYNNAAVNFLETYILGHTVNNRVHAEIHPHRSDEGGTRSLRFSYSNPPLQLMPAHDEELAPLIRGVFLPEEGEVWAKPDISQQEFRLIVHYAARHKLRGADEAAARYRTDPDTDFHALVSAMTGRDRQTSKNTNFAKAFGAGVRKFAAMIGKPESEARAIYDQYDRELPFVSQLAKRCEQAARRTGYLTLYDGARRHWDSWAPGGRWQKGLGPCSREEAERRIRDPKHPWYRQRLWRADVHKAMNALIQGSAARHTKLWMRACWREGIVPLLQMHDALDCSVTTREQGELVARLGCEAVKLEVPMRVDLKFGRSWGDAKHNWEELHDLDHARPTTPPTWAPDFPIAAKGRIADRLIETKPAVLDIVTEPPPRQQEKPTETLPFEDAMPPPEFDDPPPGDTGRAGLMATSDDRKSTADQEETPQIEPPAPVKAADVVSENQPVGNGHASGNGFDSPDQQLPWSTPTMVELVGVKPWDIDPINYPPPPPHDEEPSAGDSPPRGNGSTTQTFPKTDPELGPYVYQTARGVPHQRVIRTPWRKDRFKQQHWNGSVWQDGMPKRKLPYRLPELLDTDPAELVCLPEGEKDCVNLAKLGLVSTTNPNGADGWQKAALTPWFIGKERIAIFEDNDDASRRRTQRILQNLRGIVKDIRIVSFPELGEGKDVSDWLALGHGRDELLARIEAAGSITDTRQLESVCAADVEMRAITWLWRNRFAEGKIGIIAGLPDEGKGQILCYIAARVTGADLEWPNGEGRSPQGNVIILSAEEDSADSLVPRLSAAGADRSRVQLLKMVREHDEKGDGEHKRMFSLVSDIELLRQKILTVGNVKAVLIDPITAYLGVGEVDSYRDTDVRAVLGPLKELAEETGAAVIGVMHFNKKIDITNALLRVSNSLAFVGLPRHVYAVVADSENGRKLFVRAKNNDAAESDNQTLAYYFDVGMVGIDPRTSEPIRAPFIVWEPGYVDVTATEAMQAAAESKSPSAREDAKRFLEALLSSGPVEAKDIQGAAKANGIAIRTLRRAKEDLEIEIKQDGPVADGHRTWRWHLPTEKKEQ